MRAPELIDAAIAGQALVYGSLPPAGRDLDLLVHEREQLTIGVSLEAHGFVHRGSEWARFASCSVEIVELTSTSSWALPVEALDALFGEAREIVGLRNVVRPSPHHALLVLARRVVHGNGVLEDKLQARLRQILAEDPGAWDRAGAMAPSWRATEAVKALEEAWHSGESISRSERAAAWREHRAGERGTGNPTVHLHSIASKVPRPRRGRVVALSGLDGAGKSSQAAALQDTLERLGYKATVVRTRIAWEDSLWSMTRPVKRLLSPFLRLLAAVRPLPPPRPRPVAREQLSEDLDEQMDGQPQSADLVTSLRENSSLLTELWTLIITLANVSSQWKLMRGHLLRGDIVISDRYTLDSIVELRYSYGVERGFRAARIALSMLYPTPVQAYLLDVSADAALKRKGEWGLQWLSEHRKLYLQECGRSGVHRLDAERAEAEICAEIARDVWLSGI